MALAADDLRAHLNGVPDTDVVLARLLKAAEAHVEAHLGFKLGNEYEFAEGVPADVEQAILMVAGHFYENREATLVGVTAQELPLGVADILANHRTYTFG